MPAVIRTSSGRRPRFVFHIAPSWYQRFPAIEAGPRQAQPTPQVAKYHPIFDS